MVIGVGSSFYGSAVIRLSPIQMIFRTAITQFETVPKKSTVVYYSNLVDVLGRAACKMPAI